MDVAASGATGGQTSVFLRGASSDQSLFVVDGVRLNTTTVTYYNLLGGADWRAWTGWRCYGAAKHAVRQFRDGRGDPLETAPGRGSPVGHAVGRGGIVRETAEAATDRGAAVPWITAPR